MISALILAAGMSSRMGAPKQLLRLGGRSLIRIVTQNVMASAVDEVLVVTGCMADEVGREIKDLPVKIVYHPEYEKGQGDSLAAGVKEINPQTDTLLIFMCDQPLITPGIIDHIITEHKKDRCKALRPAFKGRPGHPVLFTEAVLEELKALAGDEGARGLLVRLGKEARELPVPWEEVVLDIDTPGKFEALKARYDIKQQSISREREL